MFACQKKQPQTPPKPMEQTQEPAKKADAKELTQACVGEVKSDKPQPVTIGSLEWEINGSTAKLKAGAKKGAIKIGALTDIKEDTPENKANVEALIKWFQKEKVDLVVVAGDTGMERNQLVGMLDLLAVSGVAVFNIQGNREGFEDFTAAHEEMEGKYKNIFSLNKIRRIDTPEVDIVSLPGYWNPKFIHADDGCHYLPEHVAGLGKLVDGCDSPVLVTSHGAPKQSKEAAIDLTSEKVHAGDPALAQLMKDKKIPFGIFGNIHEAGGRATDLDGSKVLPQGKAHPALFVNPGPADAVRWAMNDGTTATGMGGIVEIAKGKATYKIHRIEEKTN